MRKFLYQTRIEMCDWKGEEDIFYINYPFIRYKSTYRSLLRERAELDELNREYKIKHRLYKGYLWERNPWADDQTQAWGERRNWKRNSKRRKQYHNK